MGVTENVKKGRDLKNDFSLIGQWHSEADQIVYTSGTRQKKILCLPHLAVRRTNPLWTNQWVKQGIGCILGLKKCSHFSIFHLGSVSVL